jgi:phage FluMu gp28-like protein
LELNSNASITFMPYQIKWLKNDARSKIWEKSRRIGATYVQSYEDVLDCIKGNVPAVWFSSADLTAAREYIDNCLKWAKGFQAAAEDLGEQIIDLDKGVKAYCIRFDNDTRIHALSSNPSQFRSKGGKVVLDEFAYHDNAEAMWAAARPCITWGFPLRILSTHNGKGCRYYKFIDQIKRQKLNWSLQTTSIVDAVNDGLADKIMRKPLTEAERKQWLEDEEASVGDRDTWMQEYLCIAVDETTAFLTYDMIEKCERPELLLPLDQIRNSLYIGMDVARKKNLSVIWGIEHIPPIKVTRFVIPMTNAKFAHQRETLYSFLEHPNMRRACIDSTGIGNQLAEEAQDRYGKYRVEGVWFTNAIKEEMGHRFFTAMEDVSFLIPNQFEIRESFHSVRKIIQGNNVRLDADEDKKTGDHGDFFWSAVLANNAITDVIGSPDILTGHSREAEEVCDGY